MMLLYTFLQCTSVSFLAVILTMKCIHLLFFFFVSPFLLKTLYVYRGEWSNYSISHGFLIILPFLFSCSVSFFVSLHQKNFLTPFSKSTLHYIYILILCFTSLTFVHETFSATNMGINYILGGLSSLRLRIFHSHGVWNEIIVMKLYFFFLFFISLSPSFPTSFGYVCSQKHKNTYNIGR